VPCDCTDVLKFTPAARLLVWLLKEVVLTDQQTRNVWEGRLRRAVDRLFLVKMYPFYGPCIFFEFDLCYNQKNS